MTRSSLTLSSPPAQHSRPSRLVTDFHLERLAHESLGWLGLPDRIVPDEDRLVAIQRFFCFALGEIVRIARRGNHEQMTGHPAALVHARLETAAQSVVQHLRLVVDATFRHLLRTLDHGQKFISSNAAENTPSPNSDCSVVATG